MRIDVVTIFPDVFPGPLAVGILGRALERGLLDLGVWDLRAYTEDRHRTVDDTPYGGGSGMVMKPDPFVRAVDAIRAAHPGSAPLVLLTSPQGRLLSQGWARELARLPHLVVLCGRYEGVDERVVETLGAEEVSIGDYVLTGGELAAMVIIEALGRLLPGAVGDAASVADDSFSEGRLGYPQYTRPAEFRGRTVPEVLLSGHHEEIRRWRKRMALERTLSRRPDLIDERTLDEEARAVLAELRRKRPGGGAL
jgi:tRNA (guanine37-N1)-methyltransferase